MQVARSFMLELERASRNRPAGIVSMLAYDIVLIILEFLMRDGCRLCNGYFCPPYPPNYKTTSRPTWLDTFGEVD